MAYIRTFVQNLGAIRRPVRKTCLLSLIIDVSTMNEMMTLACSPPFRFFPSHRLILIGPTGLNPRALGSRIISISWHRFFRHTGKKVIRRGQVQDHCYSATSGRPQINDAYCL